MAERQQKNAILRLQRITIAWLTIEFCLAMVAGIHARSVALTAFGADSAIELLSAAVVLHRFKIGAAAEDSAARWTAVLLYALAGYIVISSSASLIFPFFRPRSSYTGICLLIAAAILMPWLGREKKRLAVRVESQALKADAAQSSICAYLSWIALAGLLANSILHWGWADSAAALLLLPLVLHEANEARKGKKCC